MKLPVAFRPIPASVLPCLLICLVGILVYGNHLHNPFQFDSVAHILNNPRLQHPEEMLSLEFVRSEFFARGLLRLTIAFNAHLDGFQTFGYHLVNLTLHLINSILIFFITGKALRYFEKTSYPWDRNVIRTVPLFTALLFLVHPVQTESVTYIISRSEVLSATLYLGAFLLVQTCLDRNREVSLVFKMAATAGMAAAVILGYSIKQTIVTLPMMLLIYYLCGCRRESGPIQFLIRWRWVLGLGFSIFLFLLFQKLLTDESFLIGPSTAGEDVGRKNYMFSQPGVIVFYYLRLLLFPVNLNVDPDIVMITGFGSMQFWLAALVILFILLRAATAKGSRIYLFCVAWFFIVLSPSSSIITLNDLAAEHRVYLACYGIFLPLALAGMTLMQRFGSSRHLNPKRSMVSLTLMVTVLLGVLTIQRNTVWSSEFALWEDALKKSPRKGRSLINLGRAYTVAGNIDRAIHFYELAMQSDPTIFATNYNLGELYWMQGRVEEGLRLLHRAARIKPNVPEVYEKLGEVYLAEKKYKLAEQFFRRAVEVSPGYAVALRNLGIVNYFHLNNVKAGLAYFKRSLYLDPDQPESDNIRQLIALHAE